MTREMTTSRIENPASLRSASVALGDLIDALPDPEIRPDPAETDPRWNRRLGNLGADRRPPLCRSSSTFSLHVGS
jgi:hypothetical protein